MGFFVSYNFNFSNKKPPLFSKGSVIILFSISICSIPACKGLLLLRLCRHANPGWCAHRPLRPTVGRGGGLVKRVGPRGCAGVGARFGHRDLCGQLPPRLSHRHEGRAFVARVVAAFAPPRGGRCAGAIPHAPPLRRLAG